MKMTDAKRMSAFAYIGEQGREDHASGPNILAKRAYISLEMLACN